MVKKFLYTLINTVSLLIIVAAVAVLVLVLFTPSGRAPQVLGYTMLRVTTGSMEPTYAIDTLIVVKRKRPLRFRRAILFPSILLTRRWTGQ